MVHIAILNKIEQALKNDQLAIQEKSEWSKFYAEYYYRDYGKQIEHLSPDGNYVLYEPSTEEKEFREEIINTMQLTEWVAKSMRSSMYFWLITLTLSLLLGFLTPVGKTNPTIMQNGR